ncbi:MAG: radical SAM family heme chaperone HemW [Thermotogae bacterium]|nr:radical SAM family heme chaperone HemW [Thermotogota bacterium]MCL5031782.1 radical SAM family heme chaperone HemW [Thermotogota bacterium]
MKTDISIYVHVPFCSRRCIYCDFASYVNDRFISDYFDAVCHEIEIVSNQLGNAHVFALYFGGGTPSHVPVKYISNLVDKIRVNFRYDPAEITFEMNPEDVTVDLCHDLKVLGVNRVSLGLQSTSDQLLKVIGRPYNLETFLKEYEIIRMYFDNVNVDLMYNLPFEILSDVESDLKIVEKIRPDHVSFYELEVHEEAPLYPMIKSGVVKLPSEDESEKMYETIIESLDKLGYERYELSSWTKGKPSIHNINYWENGEYIGFGLSAGSHREMRRWVNTLDLGEYIQKLIKGELPRTYNSVNAFKAELAETFFMGLRLEKGINLVSLKEKFGNEDVNFYIKKLEKFCGEFLDCSNEIIKFTPNGMKFSALVLSELV